MSVLTARAGYSYRQFSWDLAKLWLVFLIVAGLFATLVDAAACLLAAFADFAGLPNRFGHFERSSVYIDQYLVFTAIFHFAIHLLHQIASALFATLSFVVLGRVVLWWMVGTAPIVVYLSGFSLWADFYYGEVPTTVTLLWPVFFGLLAVQILVVVVCWLLVRQLIRPPLRFSTVEN